MSYSFENLSHADFEDLVRDLIGCELEVRFEAFSAGPDGGIDGRHAKGAKTIVLQAKHYCNSPYASLRAAMKRERASIEKLVPNRYLLATSRTITPGNKSELAKLIGPALKRLSDIFSPTDLNGLLRKFPEIEKANVKLWLSSSAVMERIIRSGVFAYTAASRSEIEDKVKIYAQNPSFSEARQRLEANHVIIISGPPGVGKTTLAEMLAYAYISEEWEFVAIRSLDDGFSRIVDTKPQVFFFDDFLGKIALDTRSLANKDSELAKFIRRVRKSRNARFILTTRAYILEEARRISEHLADRGLEITKYLLDVGAYTRRIRARILYNHLVVAKLPIEYRRALTNVAVLSEIIDHPNYNPRIIEAMTDLIRLQEIKPEAYGAAFIEALNNPHQIWDIAFRTHIPAMCRHLLLGLFFCSQYGTELGELKVVFDALHPALCRHFGLPHDPKDFEESVRVLEGSFIKIRERTVSFLNPSVRDYLTAYLNDSKLLTIFASVAPRFNWARELWRHVHHDSDRFSTENDLALAQGLAGMCHTEKFPLRRQSAEPPYHSYPYDLYPSQRIELLLDWAVVADNEAFSQSAITLLKQAEYTAWSDGTKLIDLFLAVRNDEFYKNLKQAMSIVDLLEEGIVGILRDDYVPSDDLESMCDRIEENRNEFSTDVISAMREAIVREIESAYERTAGMDSESTLSDHATILEKLGNRIGLSRTVIEDALLKVEERIGEVRDDTSDAESPQLTGRRADEEAFDNTALKNLFAPLAGDTDML
ncbi:nSTAND3 domain-containing NTPase [Bradyrhizobium liaoningense]